MSWQLGVILLLGAVLVAGFAWYERSRPSSRVVALVAVLAALAVAGRVALAPIPNVAATTDIALLAGYSLGAAPGFAVGALAGFVSNFWLGQGPWTLWQMIAWGGIGIGGALLARITARRLGRYGLAAAAAAAGLAYGAFLDFSVMVNFGGEQSLDRYLALSARGIPFNLAHAAGNAALMLVAGPALVSMLTRFRERSQVEWADASPQDGADSGRARGDPKTPGWVRGTGAAVLILIVAVALGGFQAERAGAAGGQAQAWLEDVQSGDGGFGIGSGEASSVEMTGWAALGLEAAGVNPADSGTPSALRYLRERAGELRSTGDLERTILVAGGAGVDPRDFGGRDLLAKLEDRRGDNGSWEGQVNLTAFGILAMRAAGRPKSRVEESGRWLAQAVNDDGGWGSRAGTPSEPDSTGAVLQALAVAPNRVDDGHRAAGVEYLKLAQRGSGGWSLTAGGQPNSQSTAWALQGLQAAGVDPDGVRRGGNSGLDFLADRQAGDGHYRYSAASDQTPVWVTAQALLAVEGATFPLRPVARTERAQSDAAADRGDGRADGSATAEGRRNGEGGKSSKSADDGDTPSKGAAKDEPAAATMDEDTADAEVAGEQVSSAALRPAADTAVQAGTETADRSLRWIGLGGLLLITVALVAGFFWYRRTLP
ncbi:MAG: hypothetical protein ACR2N5_08040 [Solirubrobacterales bacterium]